MIFAFGDRELDTDTFELRYAGVAVNVRSVSSGGVPGTRRGCRPFPGAPRARDATRQSGSCAFASAG